MNLVINSLISFAILALPVATSNFFLSKALKTLHLDLAQLHDSKRESGRLEEFSNAFPSTDMFLEHLAIYSEVMIQDAAKIIFLSHDNLVLASNAIVEIISSRRRTSEKAKLMASLASRL